MIIKIKRRFLLCIYLMQRFRLLNDNCEEFCLNNSLLIKSEASIVIKND